MTPAERVCELESLLLEARNALHEHAGTEDLVARIDESLADVVIMGEQITPEQPVNIVIYVTDEIQDLPGLTLTPIPNDVKQDP